jgi:hypothetical protein
MRATATHEKLLGIFTLMNQNALIVTNWEKKTCNEAKSGQVWARKTLRDVLER